MEYYEFVTIWRFEAPLEKVWTEIKTSETWSDWWKGVLKVEKIKGRRRGRNRGYSSLDLEKRSAL